MKVKLHQDEQGFAVLTDPTRLEAQLLSQPISRLIRTLGGVISELYLANNAEWDSSTVDRVASALDEIVVIDNLDRVV